MNIKLSKSQMTTLHSMMEISGRMADQLLHIMQNSGLDKIEGCNLRIEINPGFRFVTKQMMFGHPNADAGYIVLAKGVYDESYRPTGDNNSAEYELLFADETVRTVLQEQLHPEKPLPPDGMWFCNNINDPPVDCRGKVMRFEDIEPGKVGGC